LKYVRSNKKVWKIPILCLGLEYAILCLGLEYAIDRTFGNCSIEYMDEVKQYKKVKNCCFIILLFYFQSMDGPGF